LADKKHGKAVLHKTSRKFSSFFGSVAIGKVERYYSDIMKCPGQDTRYWKKEDIFEVRCPVCHTSAEFFKDDVRRRCNKCNSWVPNPKLDLGCIEWCNYAEECVGKGYIKKQKISK
jgi:hypothetical protein